LLLITVVIQTKELTIITTILWHNLWFTYCFFYLWL